MSMHTTGSSELGLIITGDNIDRFVSEYIRQNLEEFKEIAAEDMMYEMYEYLDCNESFTSCGRRENFCARTVGDDWYYPEIYFLSIADDSEYSLLEYLPFIFVPADKGCIAKNILNGKFYGTKEELIEEFREKVGSYLPEDFDYESSIGDMDYAIFC